MHPIVLFRTILSGMRNDLRMGALIPQSTVLEKAPWVRGLVLLAVVMFLPFAKSIPQESIGNGLPYPPPQPGVLPMSRTANPTADANRLLEDSMKLEDNHKRFELINVQRQKEMTSAAVILIQLADQLKTDTNRGTPVADSTIEIRKAELIEKLAHNIQNKMTATVSTNN
jgi:hypothetical protein